MVIVAKMGLFRAIRSSAMTGNNGSRFSCLLSPHIARPSVRSNSLPTLSVHILIALPVLLFHLSQFFGLETFYKGVQTIEH